MKRQTLHVHRYFRSSSCLSFLQKQPKFNLIKFIVSTEWTDLLKLLFLRCGLCLSHTWHVSVESLNDSDDGVSDSAETWQECDKHKPRLTNNNFKNLHLTYGTFTLKNEDMQNIMSQNVSGWSFKQLSEGFDWWGFSFCTKRRKKDLISLGLRQQ